MQRAGSGFPESAAGAARAALTVPIVVLVHLAGSAPAVAQPRCEQPAAIVRTIDNRVRVTFAAAADAVPASRDMPVCAGDTIHVDERSRAIVFVTGSNTLLRLDQNSELLIADVAPTAARPYITLLRGALLFITRLRRSFEVRTPFVNASVEGTEFVVRVGADRTLVTVLEGTVRAANDLGAVVLGAGQEAIAIKGQAPQIQVVVRPRDAVQWALYYEPVLPADTFERLDAVPEADRDAAFFVRRAALLLGVGQLQAARADLDRSEKLAPANADALALRAIVAVALNDKSQALESGRRAVEQAPTSSSARLALSYALQANFQLEEARDVVAEAVSTTPDNAPGWTRLAELRLMLDDASGAAVAAERAVALSPESGRPRVVLGFTSLARLNVSDAERQFDEAIRLDSTDPLARLGRGLAQIRRGRLTEGRSDLELAVALNPDSAIARSYLGKAYFDEKHDALAGEQFASAQELDPLDPTAWYYDAIRGQTQNRPVEALADIEQAIRLNASRAVYRSRFLLDEDVAARGARLGRVYRDLGFEQLALVEGWKSVAADPANHAAHRLLADNYLVLPRHQIARDSELLQAQLLQPLNINPVQPRLAGNGLNFLDDTGSYGVGFNEYTRLFAGNQVRFVGDGIVGTQGTRADNVIVSGLFDRWSYSAGQFHYESDGIRPNNDSRHEIYHVFLQGQATRTTSAQIEVRRTEFSGGDQRLLFDATNFLARVRNPVETTMTRVGGRQRIGTAGTVLASYLHQDLDFQLDTGVGFRVATEQSADSFELRYLHAFRRVNVSGGAGHYTADQLERRSFGPMQFPLAQSTIRHTNGYIYADAQVVRSVVLSAGLSRDEFENAFFQRGLFSPKLGATWTIDAATTVRAAATRSLKRTLVLTQTIEPTHVAGFNQFFDDTPGSDAWRYGVGIDRRFGVHLFGGGEISRRDLDSPTVAVATSAVTFTPETEWFANAYVYAAPINWLAVSGQYQFARLDLHPSGNNASLLAESTTHKLGVEVRAFARWGGFGRVRGWFVDQDGRFQSQQQVVVPGADRFVTFDASLGYRMPRRLGVIAIDIRNAFDEEFNFQDTSPEEALLVSARQVFVRLTLTF